MAEASAAASRSGLVLGRYRPLRPLGSGGMGSVWHARDEQEGRDVALKIVSRTGSAGPRAEREAAAAAQLKHPACLRAYALTTDAEHVYIAYEYVPGRTLRHALERGELDDVGAVEAAAQILEGLAHAHSRGIVHRDVKPANILLAESPARRDSARRRASPGGAAEISVRILDFGLALVSEEETLTAAGDVPGTLAYISPERLAGKPAGPETDVWSVGVLLWESLAGRHPFGAGPFMEIAKRIGRGAPPLATARPDLPAPLAQLVDSALAVEPENRPSAAKLAAGLRRAVQARTHPAGVRRAVPVPPIVARLVPAVPAAMLAGWTSATFAFFPAHWPAGLAAVAALLTVAGPRLGLAFALAVPVLPLGNISLGLAIFYGLLACGWLGLFWAQPRAALLFVAGPLLAPVGGLGLTPLVVLAARDPFRRAAQAAAAVLTAAIVAAVSGHGLPVVGGPAPDWHLGGLAGPLGAASALWAGISVAHALLFETGALVLAATVIGSFRRRGAWGAATFGSLLTALTLLADPAASALPLVAAAWITALALAAEPGPARPALRILGLVQRISPSRPRLRAVTPS